MKRKIALTLALSAVLLAGCGKENDLINNSDISETVSDSLTQAAETEEDTQFTLGGETETEAAETDTVPEIETEYPAEGVSYKILNYGGLNPDGSTGRPYGNQSYKDGVFCITYMMSSPEDYPEGMKLQMRFYDTAENKFLASVDIPTGWNIYEKLAETDSDIFCRYALARYFYDEVGNATGSEQAVLTVRRDFSSDIAEGYYTARDCSVKVCGHNIADWERDIIDTDSGEILVEGYDGTSEYDLSVTIKRYRFPIDENRFVYSTIGYENIPGFGVYDFSTGTASDVPGSRDLVPLGIRGGRIYSLQSEWDSGGHDTELYVTDTETLETELFMEAHVPFGLNDHADYEMTESGSVIVMGYYPDDETVSPQLYLIDPDTKEYTVCDIPDEFRGYGFSRTNDGAFIMSNWEDKALIIEINV